MSESPNDRGPAASKINSVGPAQPRSNQPVGDIRHADLRSATQFNSAPNAMSNQGKIPTAKTNGKSTHGLQGVIFRPPKNEKIPLLFKCSSMSPPRGANRVIHTSGTASA